MDSSNEGLLYEGSMPIAISTIEHFPTDSEFVTFNEINESLLKANLVLHEPPEVDEHDEISLELRRQDMKISLLLELVGELLRHNQLVPEAQKIKLTSSNLECLMPEDLKPTLIEGSKVCIDLYMSSSTPKPLKLFGSIVEITQNREQLGIKFSGLTQITQGWIEKTIFRHHRRTVAQGLSQHS